MKTSRNYVKLLLEKEGKKGTKVYKSLKDVVPHMYSTGPKSALDIKWNEFSDEEVNSLSRIKFKKYVYLSTLAQREKNKRAKSNTSEKKEVKEMKNVGPEPY